MAIDYSQYARSYAGSPEGYAQLGAGISRALEAAGLRKREEELATVSQAYQDALTGDLMGGDLYKMMSTPAKDWGKMSGTVMPNAFDAYNAFKASVEGTPQEKIARRQGLLNPITFKQQHDSYKSMLIPSIQNRIIEYQAEGNKSDNEMREWIQDNNLAPFIASNFPVDSPIAPYIMPRKKIGEQFVDIGKGLIDPYNWTPSGAIGTGVGAIGSGVLAKRFLGDKMPSSKKILEKAGVSGGKGLTKSLKAGGKAPQSMSEVKSLWSKLSKKHGGTSGIISKLMKKSPGQGIKILAKLGIGAAGTFTPELFSTAAGLAMTGLTLWQLSSLLSDE
tara:strand:+ start:347 stop:1345 length:999 start_codon:yes stop_codon:yes gene_type:complete